MTDTIDKFEKHRDAAHVRRVTQSPADAGVVVKPLEWAGNEGRRAGLKYIIAEPDRTRGWRVWANLTDINSNGMATSIGGHIVTMKAESRDAAIAAAQADYESRIISALTQLPARPVSTGLGDLNPFQIGDRVTKIKGSSWTGRIVGYYSTELTPVGCAVESENEPGSVQIYPAATLSALEGEKP